MKINILVNHVFDGWEPTDTRLGGTEEGVVRWADELASRGHAVSVYRNGRKPGLIETTYPDSGGYVGYYPRELYKGGGDVCLNHKSLDIPKLEPTLYFTTETDATDKDLSAFDAVVWPSNWAALNIPVNNDNVLILPYGYDDSVIYPEPKVPKQCFYASSPDRGLDTLLAAWPEVHTAHPDATLIVTYGGEVNLHGVINLGEVDEETMNEIYRTSDIWCHPCNGGELYCITGKKAQAAACIPVIIPTMALSETVARGYKVENPDDYAKTLIEVLNTPMEFRDKIREDVKAHAYTPSWSETTDLLLKMIENVV